MKIREILASVIPLTSAPTLAGTPLILLAPEFQVNNSTTDPQRRNPVFVSDGSGSFVVWSVRVFESRIVFGQRFDRSRAKTEGEFKVNSYSKDAYTPSDAVDGSGNFVVAWTS